MTAFSRQEIQTSWGNAIWELRSVNHRFLEMGVRLPDNFASFDPLIREKVKKKLQRGKIDISLRYKPTTYNQRDITLNTDLVKQLFKTQADLATLGNITVLNSIDILNWPGVLAPSEDNIQQTQQDELLHLFDQALNEFITVRQREGCALQKLLEQRLVAMQTEITNVKRCFPEILHTQREKLIQRFHEAKLTLDNVRFEQEMVFFAQKIDVTEEIDRLETHIQEVHRTLQQSQSNPAGRRLDFLLQELNREANTLGSKSVTTDTTLTAVELKVLIEQMREQVQNIE